MDENTQKLIHVVSKHVDQDKKEKAIDFLMQTIEEKKKQEYKDSIEMNKFILYEVNEYIKSISKQPQVISFDDTIPQYENIDSILERTMQEREELQILPPQSTSSEDVIPQKHVARELSEKHEKKEEIIIKYDGISSDRFKKERKMVILEEKKTNNWIYDTNICENAICFSLQEPQDSVCITKIAIHTDQELPDFLSLQNKCLFQRLYTPQMTNYVLYEGYFVLKSKTDNQFELEVTSFSDNIFIDWEQESNAPLIQILH